MRELNRFALFFVHFKIKSFVTFALLLRKIPHLSVSLSAEDLPDGRAERAAANPILGESMRICSPSRLVCLFFFGLEKGDSEV